MRITVQRDGRIAIREHGEEVRFANAQDPFGILECFRAAVEFEDGLTAAQMMRALRPWSKALSAAAWFDFDAWFDAMDRPYIAAVDGGEDPESIIGIEMHPTVHVRRRFEGVPKEVSFDVSWRPLGRYAKPKTCLSGKPEEHCSVSFVDPRLIGHLPISIRTEALVDDVKTRPPWGEEPILAESMRGTYDRLVGDPCFFECVVLGFLDDISFHGSPEDTESVSEGLISAVEEVRSALAAGVPFSAEPREGRVFRTLELPDAGELRKRAKLGRAIANALPPADSGSWGTLAAALGLSEAGMEKLAAGQTANYSIEGLQDFLERIESVAATGRR